MHGTADNRSLEDPPTCFSRSLSFSLTPKLSAIPPSHRLFHPSQTWTLALPDWLSLLSNAEQIQRTLRNVRLQSTDASVPRLRRRWV